MTRENMWDAVGSVALGVIGGIALAELLKKVLQKKCTICHNLNEANRAFCKFCGGRLN